MSTIDLSLYKLADALQIPLTYNQGKIGGSQAVRWSIIGGEIPFTMIANKIFATEQVGIIAHVMGDLHVIVSHFPQSGTVSAYLVDASKSKLDGVKIAPDKAISKKMTLREVVDTLRPAIVAAYYWKQDKWRPLALPS